MENIQDIDIKRLEVNKGQVEGLPKNPRFIRDERYKALVKSIEDAPEMLKLRELLVVEHGKKFVVIGGNMRLRACKELGMETVPCKVLPADTPTAKLREYAIKDNNGFGEDDLDILANEWDAEELEEWGVELPMDWDVDDADNDNGHSNDVKEIPQVEEMLNNCTRSAAKEITEQFDKLKGFSFITPSIAKFNFVRFKYYNTPYARNNSLAFHEQQFITAGDHGKGGYGGSAYDGLISVYDGDTNPERLRFVTGEKFSSLISGSLPFAAYRIPLDFPAELSRALCEEFIPKSGGKMLDPCSGWGGRLVGFLAADIENATYTGIDASPLQVKGDLLIYDTFKDVCEESKRVSIAVSPFEKYELQPNTFNFALTSPPYFDTEQYIGGEQSHENYSNYDACREGFYAALIEKVYAALIEKGVFCLQIGSQRYPLLEDGKRIAENIGFKVEGVRATDMTNSFCGTDEKKGEVIIVLRK